MPRTARCEIRSRSYRRIADGSWRVTECLGPSVALRGRGGSGHENIRGLCYGSDRAASRPAVEAERRRTRASRCNAVIVDNIRCPDDVGGSPVCRVNTVARWNQCVVKDIRRVGGNTCLGVNADAVTGHVPADVVVNPIRRIRAGSKRHRPDAYTRRVVIEVVVNRVAANQHLHDVLVVRYIK
jgi:hypothetical protein